MDAFLTSPQKGKLAGLHRGLGVLEDRQDCCIVTFINRQQPNAAQNCWEGSAHCIRNTTVAYLYKYHHWVQQEINGVQPQRCRRRTQSQSYSSRPLQKHPNLCSCEWYALKLTPQDNNTSDSTDAQQSTDLCSSGLVMAELHWNLRPGHYHFCTTFFFTPVTVLQKNPYFFAEWKKRYMFLFWAALGWQTSPPKVFKWKHCLE